MCIPTKRDIANSVLYEGNSHVQTSVILSLTYCSLVPLEGAINLSQYELTHYGLVTPLGVMDLDQHWFR